MIFVFSEYGLFVFCEWSLLKLLSLICKSVRTIFIICLEWLYHSVAMLLVSLNIFPSLVSGTDGTLSCMAAYFVCNTIFSSIISHAGDVNVRSITRLCLGYLLIYNCCA